MSEVVTEKLKKMVVARMVKAMIQAENARYGELIKQSGEIQFKLALLVVLESSLPDKKYMDYIIERAEFGSVIGLFQACGKQTPAMHKLLADLKSYQKKRNRLAHKMFSQDRLTPSECTAALNQGRMIIQILDEALEAHETKDSKAKF